MKAIFGFNKKLANFRIINGVFFHYLPQLLKGKLGMKEFIKFLKRMLLFLKSVQNNKFMAEGRRIKIGLYIPEYPSQAFFHGCDKFKVFSEKPPAITTLISVTAACKFKCKHCYQRMDIGNEVEISKLVDAFEPKEIYERLNLPLDIVKRMKKQKHPFKLMTGDLLSHYPYGKIFTIEDLETESQKFFERDRVPTGLLSGKRVKNSEGLAYEIEKEFEEKTGEDGARRFAWIFPEEVESNYKEEKNWMELQFYLPKGSYATEVIAEIIH